MKKAMLLMFMLILVPELAIGAALVLLAVIFAQMVKR